MQLFFFLVEPVGQESGRIRVAASRDIAPITIDLELEEQRSARVLQIGKN